jgi:fluoroquinolone transport system permease protein
MNAIDLLRRIGPVDLRNIGRDPMLVWIPLLPIFLASVYRFGIPPLTSWLLAEHRFDLVPYYPLLMSLFLLIVPNVAGMMTGFLLLDERDERTLQALRVTPVPLESYLAYRIGVPTAVGVLLSLAVYPLAGFVPVPLPDLIAIATVAALGAPLVMLFLAGFAENKVAGFAMVKLLNGLFMIPMVAFFVPGWMQYLAGVIPSFWAMKALWLAAEGDGYAAVLAAGVVANAVVGWLLLIRFRRAAEGA